MNDQFNTRNVAIISVAIVAALAIMVTMGVIGNNASDISREHIAIACVSHGGRWVEATHDCIR